MGIPLGSVDVGLQPDPVDYHAIYVVFVDAPGTEGSTRGTDGRVRSRLRSGLGVGRRPRRRPHEPSPPPRYALVCRPRFIRQNKQDKGPGAGVLGGPARAPYPRPGEVRETDEVTSQRYLALATLKGPQNLPQYDPNLAAIPHPQNLVLHHVSIEGYRCLRRTRASAVRNCQSMPFWAALRASAHAVTCA